MDESKEVQLTPIPCCRAFGYLLAAGRNEVPKDYNFKTVRDWAETRWWGRRVSDVVLDMRVGTTIEVLDEWFN